MHKRLNILTLTSLLLLAAASLSSCRKEPVPDTAGGSAIAFDSSVGKTKALVEDVADMTAFKVYGYYTDDDGATSNNVFDGKEVTTTDDGKTWGYTPVQYWIPDADYTFMGVCPTDMEVQTVTSGADVEYKLNFMTQTSEDEDIIDLMTAYATESTKDSTPGEVEMAFQHELVQVNIKVEQDIKRNPFTYHDFLVTDMSINNIRGKGTLTVGTTRNWIYDGSVAPIGFTYTNNEGTSIFDEPKNYVMFCDNNLMLIPQAAGTINFTINYKYRVGNRNDLTDGEDGTWSAWEQKSASGTLPAGTWKAGTNVTYSVNLYQDNYIVFTKVTVASWGTNQSGGTIIIK